MKDGIITWETQQTDYPTTGPDAEYVLDKNSGKFAAPNGSIGHRWEQKGGVEFRKEG